LLLFQISRVIRQLADWIDLNGPLLKSHL